MDYKVSSAEKSTMGNMITQTQHCLNQKGLTTREKKEANFDEMLKCETAYFSEGTAYTYHTHPNGNPYPSQQDKDTTNRFKKKFMFIGLVPTRTVVVYSAADNFTKMIGKFKV